MSVLSQKTDLYEKIAVLKTSNELYTNQNNANLQLFSSFESSFTKNNTDPFLFIIDLLKIISGSDSVSKILDEIFSGLNGLEINFKNKLKMEFAASNGGSKSAPQVPNVVQSGVDVHINKIDYYGNLYTDDTSTEYDLYLDDFSQSLVNNIKNPNTGTTLTPAVNSSFNNSTGFFTFTPSSNGGLYSTFINGLIDSITFIDTKILLATALDILFNTTNKNTDQITLEVQMDTILNKFITQTEQDDSYFTFTTEDLNDIQTQVSLSSQLYSDIGCRRVATQLSVSDINNSISAITYPVSKKVIADTITNVSNTLTNPTTNPSLLPADKQSVTNDFLSSLLTALKTDIVRKFMLSPQINIIYSIINPTIDTAFDPISDLQNRKNLIQCMMTQIINDLIADIFHLIEKEIIELVVDVAEIYIEEAFEKYKNILKSLI